MSTSSFISRQRFREINFIILTDSLSYKCYNTAWTLPVYVTVFKLTRFQPDSGGVSYQYESLLESGNRMRCVFILKGQLGLLPPNCKETSFLTVHPS